MNVEPADSTIKQHRMMYIKKWQTGIQPHIWENNLHISYYRMPKVHTMREYNFEKHKRGWKNLNMSLQLQPYLDDTLVPQPSTCTAPDGPSMLLNHHFLCQGSLWYLTHNDKQVTILRKQIPNTWPHSHQEKQSHHCKGENRSNMDSYV